jgi:hypothetical protein
MPQRAVQKASGRKREDVPICIDSTRACREAKRCGGWDEHHAARANSQLAEVLDTTAIAKLAQRGCDRHGPTWRHPMGENHERELVRERIKATQREQNS